MNNIYLYIVEEKIYRFHWWHQKINLNKPVCYGNTMWQISTNLDDANIYIPNIWTLCFQIQCLVKKLYLYFVDMNQNI